MAVIPFFVVAPLPAAVVLSALRRANMRFISQCIACAGTLLVGLPLVYQYGLMGGAVALVVTEVLFAVGQWGCLFWLLHWGTNAEPAQAAAPD
jgi:O-antigen/teichoic acid export membrane protein